MDDSSSVLLGLAPDDLPILRSLRYDGGGFGIPLERLDPADRRRAQVIYAGVKAIHDRWRSTEPPSDVDALARSVRALNEEPFVAAAHAFGAASLGTGSPDPVVAKVVHDVRGGGLTLLVGVATLFDFGPVGKDLLFTCASAARDHAKIMRNALTDIDPPTRAADEAAKPHGIDHFISKWAGAEVRVADRAVRVRVRARFEGDISARCLETSAIDRILYNYLNNAARFTADGVVTLNVFPVGAGELVRWVISNAVGADQAAWLDAKAGSDLRALFRGGLTRGGTGIGLTNCVDLVAACFGIRSPAEAVDGGYLGARVVDDHYHAWFHWPVYLPPRF